MYSPKSAYLLTLQSPSSLQVPCQASKGKSLLPTITSSVWSLRVSVVTPPETSLVLRAVFVDRERRRRPLKSALLTAADPRRRKKVSKESFIVVNQNCVSGDEGGWFLYGWWSFRVEKIKNYDRREIEQNIASFHCITYITTCNQSAVRACTVAQSQGIRFWSHLASTGLSECTRCRVCSNPSSARLQSFSGYVTRDVACASTTCRLTWTAILFF